MRQVFIILLIIFTIVSPASALEFEAPEAPDPAQQYLDDDAQTFAEGIWFVIRSAIRQLQPDLAEAGKTCLSLLAVMLLVSIMRSYSGVSKQIVDLVSALCVATALLHAANSMIMLGTQTVTQISDYNKLLLPVMTASLAAQGGTTSSAALYTGTAFFNALLSSGIANLIVPMIYIHMIMCIGYRAIGEEMLKNLRDLTKWLITWSLKIILYVFTGYLSITGVVSGTTDAAALKATKLTLSGIVPVVGNIVSDASETILVGAGVLKNAVGVYGLLVIAALWIGPFIQIGTQYLLLKLLSAVSTAFGSKEAGGLIKDFSSIMGILVAMTGTVCLLVLVSVVCYLRGVG